MYLKGHKQILDSSLYDIKLTGEQYKSLIEGLEYPDISCGYIRITYPDLTAKYIHKLCPVYSLYKLVGTGMHGNTELYQSHRGKFAINHAMTPDPKYTLRDIQYKILRKSLLYYYLAVKQNDIHWLGMMIHLISDSYSPAHTMRNLMSDKVNVGRSLKPYDYKDDITLLVASKVFKLVKSGNLHKWGIKNGREFERRVIDYLKNDSEVREALDRRRGGLFGGIKGKYFTEKRERSLINFVKITYYYNEQFKAMEKVFNVRMALNRYKWKRSDYHDEGYKYITDFQWLKNQRLLYHQYYNRIGAINDNTYNIMIKNINVILKMYIRNDSLRDVFKYLIKNVFNVNPRYIDKKSGRV